MKNKKLMYILLPLAIIIWGLIIYKIISNYTGDDDTGIVSNNNKTNALPVNIADTFSLILNYPDPFLKGEVQVTNYTKTVQPQVNYNKTRTTGKTKEIKKVNWPLIVYGGIIKNKANNKTCSIIKINNIEYIMSVGDVCKDVKLIKTYKDSVLVMYDNAIKTIVK
jgi:hypothetical protein